MVIEYFLEWVETAPVGKRVEAAGALVRAFLRHDISEEEREDVEAALTTLLEDSAPTVRLEIAEAFGAHMAAPRHIISSLGLDSIDVSIVVLSQSPVFHDAELANFAATGHEKQQIAVSCRPWMSEKVVDAIIEYSCRDACYALLVNPVACFTPAGLHVLATRFGDDTEIRNLLKERNDLSAESRLLLVEQLGSQLASMVENRNWVTEERAESAVSEACERASIIFAANSSDDEVRTIVQTKIREGKLTVSYLLRAVCMGNITLVAHAFSELSGVRFARVETVLTKDRRSAFRAIYNRAGLPESAFIIFQTAIATWRDLLRSKSPINQSRLPFLVTKEVLSVYHGEHTEVVDELLVLLRRLSAEAARESAKSKAAEIVNRPSADEVETIEHIEADVTVLEAEEIDAEEIEEVTLEPAQLSVEAASGLPAPTVTVDASFIGDLQEEDFEEMYAEIYGLNREAANIDYSRAA